MLNLSHLKPSVQHTPVGLKWQFGEYAYQRIGELCHWIEVSGIGLRFQ